MQFKQYIKTPRKTNACNLVKQTDYLYSWSADILNTKTAHSNEKKIRTEKSARQKLVNKHGKSSLSLGWKIDLKLYISFYQSE